MLRYSELPESVEYNVTVHHNARDYFVQLPVSRDPDVTYKIANLKKASTSIFYIGSKVYGTFLDTTWTARASSTTA